MTLLCTIITYVQQTNAIASVRKIRLKCQNIKTFNTNGCLILISVVVFVQIFGHCAMYMDNKGIICAMYQSHNGMHPQSKLIVWNKEPNVRYRPKTIHGHFIKAEDVRDTMHSISTQKEHLKNSSFFVKEHQEKERMLNASYEKVFTSLYWLC